jgi:hypothetical protein
MRQVIKPGHPVEFVTPSEVEAMLTEHMQRNVGSFHRHRGAFQVGAGGTGSDSIDVPPQHDWIMERVAIAGAGTVNAIIQIFENDTSPSNLLEVIQLGTAGLYSDSFDNRMHVPSLSTVLFTISGGVAGGAVAYNYQIKLERHR